jgi:hypothetical protein
MVFKKGIAPPSFSTGRLTPSCTDKKYMSRVLILLAAKVSDRFTLLLRNIQ